MKDLSQVRTEIDAVDDELSKLLKRRFELSEAVAAAKRSTGAAVNDPARERAILNKVMDAVGPKYERSVRNVYAALFGASKARQRVLVAERVPLTEAILKARNETAKKFPERAMVACAGVEGSYAQQATSRMFEVPTIIYFTGFESVFEAVENGMCPYGILPIENSAAGSVAAVYDLMREHRFHIVRALRLKVNHVLLGNPGTKLEDVREIHSHPHALSQCSKFLKAHDAAKAIPDTNTAAAAQHLAASKRTDAAVIASRACADLYGLQVLAEGIADTTFNYTRFICISKNLEIYPEATKIGIMLSLPHRPGSLSEVISKFSAIGVNLTKLESRPMPGSDFEFRFTFEFESSADNPDTLALLAELSCDPEIESFNFLGAYSES